MIPILCRENHNALKVLSVCQLTKMIQTLNNADWSLSFFQTVSVLPVLFVEILLAYKTNNFTSSLYNYHTAFLHFPAIGKVSK